jgi:hypothetical protein
MRGERGTFRAYRVVCARAEAGQKQRKTDQVVVSAPVAA